MLAPRQNLGISENYIPTLDLRDQFPYRKPLLWVVNWMALYSTEALFPPHIQYSHLQKFPELDLVTIPPHPLPMATGNIATIATNAFLRSI